jgi:tRNA threonylcarbamoyladenosine biosynthesis protein TsaB
VIVLGIETSDYINALGIVDDERILSEIKYEATSSSIEKITENIDEVLRQAGLGLNDIDGIGVGLGPGSWTGIRIGVTVAKMLAFSVNKPVAGIPTLEVLAYSVRDETRPIFAVIDVGTGDTVYAGKYRAGSDAVTLIGEYYVGDIEGLAEQVREPAIVAGARAREYTRTIVEKSWTKPDAIQARPDGAAVARLAARRLLQGESDDVLSLTPLYLKESTAKAFVNKYRSSHT